MQVERGTWIDLVELLIPTIVPVSVSLVRSEVRLSVMDTETPEGTGSDVPTHAVVANVASNAHEQAKHRSDRI